MIFIGLESANEMSECGACKKRVLFIIDIFRRVVVSEVQKCDFFVIKSCLLLLE
jgi:hypothetical protein